MGKIDQNFPKIPVANNKNILIVNKHNLQKGETENKNLVVGLNIFILIYNILSFVIFFK